MQKALAFLFFLITNLTVYSQGVLPVNQNETNATIGNARDINVTLEEEKPPITDYKITSYDGKITHVDTTLTIKKDYKYNYLRKDNYHLLPFANVGQTYNTLVYDFSNVRLKPRLGARARHFNYIEVEDISYYHVPTPLTELYFKTAFEQGQQLDAFFTINTSEQFNFSIAYKGLRSLGNYRSALTSTGNFRFTTNYHTKNNRYNLKAHIVFQDFLNEENGGVDPDFINYFLTNNSEFRDRARLEVNFQNGENILKGKRFYLDHNYALIKVEDSISHTLLKIGNVVSFEDKYYQFDQAEPFGKYGASYTTANLRDKVTLDDFYVQGYADFSNNIIGNLKFFTGFSQFNYGYNTTLILENQTITNRLKGNIIEAGAEYQKEYKGFELYGKAAFNIAGDYDGNYILGSASYQLDPNNRAKATIYTNSVAPDYHFQLYQSDYVNYNWQTDFENVKTQHLQFDLQSDKLLNAQVSYTGIEDYTYFAHNADSLTKPFQYTDRVNYLKVEANREFHFGKFSLDNTFTYQNVMSGADVFKTPEFMGRSSLYYSNHFFKKALFLQTGVTGKCFTQYQMNAYDPVLAEFYVQNNQEFGGFPLMDIFVNAKISQTRIYVKWEHFNSLFTEKNYFSAPGYPYRDWKIRFGIVWNFFM